MMINQILRYIRLRRWTSYLGQDEFKGKEMIDRVIATLGLGLIITIGYFQCKKCRPRKKIAA